MIPLGCHEQLREVGQFRAVDDVVGGRTLAQSFDILPAAADRRKIGIDAAGIAGRFQRFGRFC